MIINCDKCSATLQFDEAKMPSGNFTVRCPRCQNMISASGKSQISAVAAGVPQTQTALPPVTPQIPEISKPAPLFRAGNGNLSQPLPSLESVKNAPEAGDPMQILASLLQRGFSPAANTSAPTGDSEFEQVLLCLGNDRRETVSRQLAEAGYRVFIAETPTQALERMRDSEMMVVVFAANFAPELGGAALVQQQVHSMVSIDRRRIFLVALEDTTNSFNTHEAFIRNFNLVVNTGDAHNLPLILNRAMRDFRELYRYYLKALKQNYA